MLDIPKKLEKLPILPDKVNTLLAIKSSGNYDTKKLSQIIEYDPILSTRILKLANSQHFGFTNRIYSATQASSLFGLNFTVCVCVVELILNSLRFNLKPYGVQICEFTKLNDFLFKTLFSWINEDKASLKENLILPLFLKDIGKFFISDYLVKEGKSTKFSVLINQGNAYQVEENFVGIKSNELSAKILRKWEFNDSFISIIESLDDVNTTYESRVLRVLSALGDFSKPFGKDNILKALELSENFGLDTMKLKDVIDILEKQYKA